MTDDFKKNIIDSYPKHIDTVGDIIQTVYDRVYLREDLHTKWYNSDDIRNGTFQLYLSTLYNEKTKIFLLQKFISSDDFVNQYFSFIMPRTNKENLKPILLMLYNLDCDLRFDFFLKFYSQFESFIRLIYRKFNLKKEPFKSVFKKLSIEGDNFLVKIDTIRNSVHNGGLHMPLERHEQKVEYDSCNSKYILEAGDPILLGWEETFDTIKEFIDYTFRIVETDLISQDI